MERVMSELLSLRDWLRFSDQMPPDQVPYNDEDEDDSDEEAYDLREVSSDVEYDPDEMEIPSEDEGCVRSLLLWIFYKHAIH